MTMIDIARPGSLAFALIPDFIVMGGAMVLLMLAALRPEGQGHQRSVAIGALLVCALGAAAAIVFAVNDPMATEGMIAVDRFRWFVDVVLLAATAASIALMGLRGDARTSPSAEAYVLLLLAAGGMMLLAAARDLIIVFLGIETMSVATYVLAAFNRRSARSAEAGLKYFLLGSFSTGFLLYGIALVYGATGSTQLGEIATRVADPAVAGSAMLLVGLALLIVGFGFKVAAAPFHMWTPDVYDGAPLPITAFMATAVKAAAFAAFLRVALALSQTMPFGTASLVKWHLGLWWIAVATMVVGNVVALAQKSVKRMLAYSSIAHAGYLLVPIVTNTPGSTPSLLFYLAAYTLATLGAFAVVSAVSNDETGAPLTDFAGLFRDRPGLALAMAVCLLALLGFPLAGGAGFFAKYFVLVAARQAGQSYLAIALVVTSVISAGYYLAVVAQMFMRPRRDDAPARLAVPRSSAWVAYGAAVLLLVLGVYPTPLLDWARASMPVATSQRAVAPAIAPPESFLVPTAQ